jgi:hypothetical protein
VNVARDFEDIERDYGADAVREALGGARFVGPEFAPVGEPEAEKRSFTAAPFVYRDPTSIPRRQFLYGFELRRRQVSAVVAPGAAGKTTLKIGRAICMATGRDMLGHRVWNGPHRCWLWNLEDDLEEVEKTVHAFLKLWEIDPSELADRLFINGADSVGANGLKLATEDNFGSFKLVKPVSDALIAELKDKGIDYLDIDPFVSSHAVDENSNQAIDAVAKEWLRIAHEANCAIGLAHHLRKTTAAEFTAQDARGAGAMINAARSCLVLQRMSQDEAIRLQIPECDRKSFFKVYDDKNNKAAAALKPDWYKFRSVGLGNADVGSHGPEDNIGVIERWNAPDMFEGVTARQLYNIQRMISENPMKARKHSASNAWVGKQVAFVLDLNLDKEGVRQRIDDMIRTWLNNGMLVTVEKQDSRREVREFIEVGRWMDLNQ